MIGLVEDKLVGEITNNDKYWCIETRNDSYLTDHCCVYKKIKGTKSM